jgi:hypothetical protein
MQRRLKGYVCARVKVDLGAGGKPDDAGQLAFWATCQVKGVPSIAALTPDGTLIGSETGPDAEDVEALLQKGLDATKK